MNKIIQKLQIHGNKTQMIIVPRKNNAKTNRVPDVIQLSLDIETELNKQDKKK